MNFMNFCSSHVVSIVVLVGLCLLTILFYKRDKKMGRVYVSGVLAMCAIWRMMAIFIGGILGVPLAVDYIIATPLLVGMMIVVIWIASYAMCYAGKK